MTSFLKYEQEGGVVTLTMNQPQTRNALTGNTAVAEFVDVARRIATDMSVRVVILTGAGSVFSSGGNVKDMRRFFDDDLTPAAITEEYRNGIQRLAVAVYGLAVPVIAAVNGPAIGAGCDLTCMCDIRIAADTASFAESFIKVGIVPGDGGAWLLPRIVGASRAAEMSFTGDALDAQQALACGLVSRVVPLAGLMTEARGLADRIAANPGPTMRLTKRLLREGEHMRLESLLELSAGYQALAHKTWEHREAVTAFIEKRKPDFGEAARPVAPAGNGASAANAPDGPDAPKASVP
jgi:enoyl-CoA hydratase/carnithine racemase